VGGRKESVKGRQQRAERVVRKRQLALWNILSAKALSFHSRHHSTGLALWNILSAKALSFHSRHHSTGLALWNIASVEKLDLGRVSIPRGEPQSRKARQVLRTTEFFKNITAEAKSLSAWRKAHSALRTEFRVLSTKPKLLSAKGIAQSVIR